MGYRIINETGEALMADVVEGAVDVSCFEQTLTPETYERLRKLAVHSTRITVDALTTAYYHGSAAPDTDLFSVWARRQVESNTALGEYTQADMVRISRAMPKYLAENLPSVVRSNSAMERALAREILTTPEEDSVQENQPSKGAQEYIDDVFQGDLKSDWRSSAEQFFMGEFAESLKDGQAKAVMAHILDGKERSKAVNYAFGTMLKWHQDSVHGKDKVGLKNRQLGEHKVIRMNDLAQSLLSPRGARQAAIGGIQQKLKIPPVAMEMCDESARCLAVGLIASVYENHILTSTQ